MNTIISIKKYFILFFSLFTAIFLINIEPLQADDEKDMILIIDTSYSMVGKARGSKDILPQVKKSLPQFIEQLDKDDSITIITFDTDVKVYPTIYITDKKSKQSLIDYVNDIKAEGLWTYTSKMMKTAFRKAQEMEEKDKSRQRVIVILTDTIDDPPPGKLKDRLNIKEIAKNYQDKDWFIFFINMGEAIKNEKLAKLQNELKENVSRYSSVTNIAGKTGKGEDESRSIARNIETAIEKDLSSNIDQMNEEKIEISGEKSFPIIPLIIIIIVIALILAFLYLYKKLSGVKVTGKLEYWDHTMISPYYETFDLARLKAKVVTVGTKNSYNVTIRDIDIQEPFIITARRISGEVTNILTPGKGYAVEYINRGTGDMLKSGDMFKIANYTFKYTSA